MHSFSSIPLILVEVIPLSFVSSDNDSRNDTRGRILPSLTTPFVQIALRQWSLSFSLECQWHTDKDGDLFVRYGNIYHSQRSNERATEWVTLTNSCRQTPIVYLPTDNPTELKPWPCWLVAYAAYSRSTATSKEITIDDRTLVRILPMETAMLLQNPIDSPSTSVRTDISFPYTLTDKLSGEVNVANHSGQATEKEILQNHDRETVQSLKLRMDLLMSQPVLIGTTFDALVEHNEQKRRSHRLQLSLEAYCAYNSSSNSESAGPTHKNKSLTGSNALDPARSTIPSLLSEGVLVVHSPSHGSGKTLLVKTIARRLLQCNAIHIIQPAPLLAKYGIHADAALESILHGITMSAAVQGGGNGSICIILDQLDALLPPGLSTKNGAGDAAVPVLNAIACYLNKLSLSLKLRNEFPFPTKNPLYNLGGRQGHAVSARVCIIGIVTCPDDGGRSINIESVGEGNSTSTLLDALAGGHYRLPDPSAKTRFLAFQQAFRDAHVELTEEAKKRLPVLAASAVSARGNSFRRVARRLKEVSSRQQKLATVVADLNDLDVAMSVLQTNSSPTTNSSNISFLELPSATLDSSSANDDLFAAVGGNIQAKLALEDALALDPSKRRLMAQYGFSPPTGVLLYGPPGTGKTMLAKAVANLLQSFQGKELTGIVGGAFISLRASDIVRAQVGNSEKMVASAFETARANAPSVIFIDEFQALFTERSGSGSGKLTSTLLQCLDDVALWRDADEIATTSDIGSTQLMGTDTSTNDDPLWPHDYKNNRVVVLGATNTPWMVDKAFLRPGRFDQVVHVGLPTESERVSILMVHAQRMRLQHNTKKEKVTSLCKSIAAKCDGFSGADLVALCRAAAIRCLSEQGESGVIEERHFLEAREQDVDCSSSHELVQRLSDWKLQ